MKKLLFIAILCIGAITYAQETASANAGAFEFDSETIDYGSIELNADGNRTFTFKNVGEAPIIITNVKSSCGCTVASKPNDPVMPGETGEISVKYATNRVGGFSKAITITSNASESTKVVRIKGTVLKESTVATSN